MLHFSASDRDLDFGDGPGLVGSWTRVFRGSNDDVGALVTVVASSFIPRHAGWRERQRFAVVLLRARLELKYMRMTRGSKWQQVDSSPNHNNQHVSAGDGLPPVAASALLAGA